MTHSGRAPLPVVPQGRSSSKTRDELKAQVRLPADTSRRLREVTDRTGLEPQQVLAQLADRVRMNDDSTLTIDTFTPH